ncbi:unnamed protein product [Didymodactylos carnosus]|uniref:MAM domain-containing protein n=1 Tax=Didymodactylos carnosus TaxID=1234261 RepID=A0A813VE36_9BILA|nr:unnamed protein product [Didymodactylos carnosus]CAF3626907.1 unnamed protein product [Didymodactylos carnosus]
MKWREGENEGILVAGGNGVGNEANQFDRPGDIFVIDTNNGTRRQIFVVDSNNHRIQKWDEGNLQSGITVAGGSGQGSNLNQLAFPTGVGCKSNETNENEQKQLKCDFETPVCQDFLIDPNWSLATGGEYDHTFGNESGHYLVYVPPTLTSDAVTKISTSSVVNPSGDIRMCFQFWYSTSGLVAFNVDLVRGDDPGQQLKNTITTINEFIYKNWTQLSIPLPNEIFKIEIVVNASTGQRELLFDDLSVDYCAGLEPLAAQVVLLQYHFEINNEQIQISYFPEYPYQWSVVRASDAHQQNSDAPGTDFTLGTGDGHYYWINSTRIEGGVGYFGTFLLDFSLDDPSYCLHFRYFQYGNLGNTTANLKIFTMDKDTFTLRLLWPHPSIRNSLAAHKWSWGVTNLLLGQYYVLFRVDNSNLSSGWFAIDEIKVSSCENPKAEVSDEATMTSVLVFECYFSNSFFRCEMENDEFNSYNFSVHTGETIPDKEMGPLVDHTSGTSSGSFIYWDFDPKILTNRINIHDIIQTLAVELNSGMCLRFSFYLKTSIIDDRSAEITLSVSGDSQCFENILWSRTFSGTNSSSRGWETVNLALAPIVCTSKFQFHINQSQETPRPISVSFALDDILINQCSKLPSLVADTSTTLLLSDTSTTLLSSGSSEITTPTFISTSTNTARTTTASLEITKCPPHSSQGKIIGITAVVSALTTATIIIGGFGLSNYFHVRKQSRQMGKEKQIPLTNIAFKN